MRSRAESTAVEQEAPVTPLDRLGAPPDHRRGAGRGAHQRGHRRDAHALRPRGHRGARRQPLPARRRRAAGRGVPPAPARGSGRVHAGRARGPPPHWRRRARGRAGSGSPTTPTSTAATRALVRESIAELELVFASRGRRPVKVVPSASLDRASISPPGAGTICPAMECPRPRLPGRRWLSSPRRSGSKSVCSAAQGFRRMLLTRVCVRGHR
jgi:hypothetical protein